MERIEFPNAPAVDDARIVLDDVTRCGGRKARETLPITGDGGFEIDDLRLTSRNALQIVEPAGDSVEDRRCVEIGHAETFNRHQ